MARSRAQRLGWLASGGVAAGALLALPPFFVSGSARAFVIGLGLATVGATLLWVRGGNR